MMYVYFLNQLRNGMRSQKKVGAKVTDYYYDSNNNLIAEKTDSATLFFYYDTENSPVALSYNGKMFYYVKNLQGDIVKILDEGGQEKADKKESSSSKSPYVYLAIGMSVIIVIGCIALAPGTGGASLGGIAFA